MVFEDRLLPWHKCNIPGPKQGKAIDEEFASLIISRAKNPIIIVGAKILEDIGDFSLLDYTIDFSSKRGMPVVATAHTPKAFLEKNVYVKRMGVVEVTNALEDEEWSLNGKKHDLVIIYGIHYYLASQMLSSLKHFSEVKTLSLCRYYHPNADYSFPNLTKEEWIERLLRLSDALLLTKLSE